MDKTYTNGSDRTEEHILVCLSSSPSNKKLCIPQQQWLLPCMHVLPRFMFKNRILSDTSDKKGLKNIFILLKNWCRNCNNAW